VAAVVTDQFTLEFFEQRARAPVLHYRATENAGSVLRVDIGAESIASPDSAG
jgi:hypothetical protein